MTADIAKAPSRGLQHWAIFAVGLTTVVRFEAIGFLFGSEILLALFALGLAAARRNILRLRPFLWTLASFGLLCGAIFIVDRMRHISFENSAKGMALYIAIGLELVGVFAICGRDLYRQMTLLVGVCSGTILQFALFGGFRMAMAAWKFAYGVPTTIIVCIVAGMAFGASVWTACILVGMAVLNLLLDFRSLAGLCLFAAAGVVGAPGIRRWFGRPSYKVLVAAGFVALALVAMFSAAYTFAASSGLMSREAQHRFLMQNAAEGGYLLAARSDLIGAVLAIRKSPIVGFGSAAEDPEIARLTVYLSTLVNPAEAYHDPFTDRIPTHSYLLGAWVQIGIVGALFWAVWFVLTTRAGITVLWLPDTLIAGWLVFILLSLWNILASPLGSFERLQTAILINFILTVMFTRTRGRPHG